MTIFSDETLLQPNPDTVFGDVDGELLALNLESGSYLQLNSSGSFIFSLIDAGEPRLVGWLYRRIQQEYAVDDETCRREVGTFLVRCVDLDLLQVAET